MSVFSGPNAVPTGLVLCLDVANQLSYPGSGTAWNDVSGYRNIGTLTNTPTYTAGDNGYFTFSSNNYVTAPASSLYAFGTGDFALECWYYATSYSGYNHLMSLPDQGTMALKANTGDGAIYLYSPSWTTYGSTPGWTLALNTWNHVVFTRASSVGYAYLNSTPCGSAIGFTNNFSAQILNIHNGWGVEFVPCRISSTRMYNRALSATEVTQNFNALRGRYGV